MTVKDNLIAAKALIDTPEKFAAYGMSRSRAIYEASANWDEYFAADTALSQHQVLAFGHEGLMNAFSRAIAAQDEVAK